MNYELFPKVTESGFVNTGVSAVINDRNTELTVPWAVPESQRSSGSDPDKNFIWKIKSEDGVTYTVTVAVNISVSGNTTTVKYTKGHVTIAAPQNGGA